MYIEIGLEDNGKFIREIEEPNEENELLKKRENENFWEYCSRLYRNKVELGITNNEIYNAIVEETGTDKAESTVRCRSNDINYGFSIGFEQGLSKKGYQNKIQEVTDLIGELDVKKQEVKNKTNKLNKIKRDFVKSIEIANDIKECLMKYTEIPSIEGDRIGLHNDNKLIVQCGDWHIGYVIKEIFEL